MSPRSQRIRLGLFVVVAGVLLATLVVLFGSLPTFFERTTTYTIRFTEAPGLAPGAPVRRSGVRIGEVRRITLDEERGIVRVQVAIRNPYTIRKNEEPTIIAGLLGSDASIDFLARQTEPGEAVDRDPVEPGAEVVGTRAATVGTLLRGASDVVPTTQETLNDIRKSIQRLEKLAARVEKSVPLADETMRAYRDLARRAQESIPEIEKTNTQAQEFIRAARAVLPEFERTAEQVRLLAQEVRSNIPEVMKAVREIQELAAGIRNALPAFERAADEVRELTSEVRKLLPTVRSNIEDVGAAARKAQALLEDINVFWQKNRETVEELLNRVNRFTSQALKLVTDENINMIRETLKNVGNASVDFPRITREIYSKTLPTLNTSLEEFQKAMIDLRRSFSDLGKITGPFSGRSELISRNLEEITTRLNATLGDVRALMTAIDRADGSLKRFLTDPSMYNNIDTAVMMVLRSIPRVDRILKDFETFADKLARRPELLGVGGAVRPSSGLKDPPTPPIATNPHTPIMHTPQSQKR